MKKIKVHGWVMLSGIKEGAYMMEEVNHIQHGAMYWFSKQKTPNKKIIGHRKNDVDMWIKPKGVQNNFIEIQN